MKFILFVFSISQALSAISQSFLIDPVRVSPTDILQTGSEPLSFCDWNRRLYFTARKNKLSPYYLYAVGRKDSLAALMYSQTLNEPGELTPLTDRLLLTGVDADGARQLWSADGSSNGISCLSCNIPEAKEYNIYHLEIGENDNHVYFLRYHKTNSHIADLWKTDLDGSAPVRILQGLNFVTYMKISGSRIYIQYELNGAGQKLMIADTSGANLKRLNPDLLMCASPFTAMAGYMYFSGLDSLKGVQLWRSDGSTAGTEMVKLINPFGDANPGFLNVINSKLYFSANNGVNGYEIWSTDGSEAGTVMLTDKNPQLFVNPQRLITGYKNRIYFTLNDGIGGEEIWSTDATGSATRLLKDFNPGVNGSECSVMKVFDNLLFFVINNGSKCQLWVSDGTENGTKEVKMSGAKQYDALCNSFSALCVSDSGLYLPVYTSALGYVPGRCTLNPNSNINVVDGKTGIIIYPNPLSGTELHFSSLLSGTIMNISGQVMSVFHDSDLISVSGWPCGVYCLIGNNGMVYRFVIATD